jgi:hypothetical protein
LRNDLVDVNSVRYDDLFDKVMKNPDLIENIPMDTLRNKFLIYLMQEAYSTTMLNVFKFIGELPDEEIIKFAKVFEQNKQDVNIFEILTEFLKTVGLRFLEDKELFKMYINMGYAFFQKFDELDMMSRRWEIEITILEDLVRQLNRVERQILFQILQDADIHQKTKEDFFTNREINS